jgi:hypothetical protein
MSIRAYEHETGDGQMDRWTDGQMEIVLCILAINTIATYHTAQVTQQHRYPYISHMHYISQVTYILI